MRLIQLLLLAFLAITGWMHVAQPDLSPIDAAVSFYMNGRFGWLLGAGIVALGMASLLLARAICGNRPGEASRVGIVLLSIWGTACVIAGLFPPDPFGQWSQPPTLSGLIHGSCAMVAFIAFPVAAILLSRKPVTTSMPASMKLLAVLSVGSTIIFIACLLPAFQNRAPYSLGLAERVVLTANLAWLLVATQHTFSDSAKPREAPHTLRGTPHI